MIFRRSFVKFYISLILFFIVLPYFSLADKPVFRLVKEIGDDRENYMFARVLGIAISDKKEIFVADKKFISIRKYGWDGKFITKAGQLGRGPGDFITLSKMQWFDNKLFVHDSYNKRIAITNSQMKRFDYIKTHLLGMKLGGGFPIRNAPVMLDNNRVLVINAHYDDEGRLIIFDRNQNIVQRFFCDLPADIADKKDSRFFFPLTHPNLGVNHEKKQILVTFDYPDRDFLFYLYDFSGQLIRHFTYPQEEGFRFPIKSLDRLSDKPENYTMVFDVYGYKDYYMVFFLSFYDYNNPSSTTSKWYFLFFRENGEFIYKMPWDVRFLTITPDGYLGGIKEVGEEIKVRIYKFDPEALEAVARK